MLRMKKWRNIRKAKDVLIQQSQPKNLHSLSIFKQNPYHLSGVFATLGQNKDIPQGTIIKVAKS